MSELRIYRLLPVVDEQDPRWDNAQYKGEVVVRARSAADARIVAAGAEDDLREIGAAPGDENSTRTFSAFRDDKLYTVIEDTTNSHRVEGERAVLAGIIEPIIVSVRSAPPH